MSLLYILLLVDRLCEEKTSGSRFFSVVVVGVGTTLCVFGPILSSFIHIFCVVIIADIVFIDYHFFFSMLFINFTYNKNFF